MYSSAYVWAKVLGNMESRLTPAVISTWFDDAEILELTDTKLVLYSPSSFRKDIILRRCTDYIKDAMRDEFQMEVELEVIDDTEIDTYREIRKSPILWNSIRSLHLTNCRWLLQPLHARGGHRRGQRTGGNL